MYHLCWMKLAVKSGWMVGGWGSLKVEENLLTDGPKEVQLLIFAAVAEAPSNRVISRALTCMI